MKSNNKEKPSADKQHNFPEKREKDSNKAGTPDKHKSARPAKGSAKNSK